MTVDKWNEVLIVSPSWKTCNTLFLIVVHLNGWLFNCHLLDVSFHVKIRLTQRVVSKRKLFHSYLARFSSTWRLHLILIAIARGEFLMKTVLVVFLSNDREDICCASFSVSNVRVEEDHYLNLTKTRVSLTPDLRQKNGFQRWTINCTLHNNRLQFLERAKF